MNLARLRLVSATALAGAVCLVLAPRPSAGPTEPRYERLIARALDPTDAKAQSTPIEIVIERWSTDKEADTFHGLMKNESQENFVLALERTRPRVGVLRYPGVQASGDRARLRKGAVVQFAREIKSPAGRRVIVGIAGERPPLGDHVGLAELRAKDAAPPEKPGLTVIEIRFASSGKATGKVASLGHIVYDDKARTFEVANYDKQPVRLTDVTSEQFDGGFARKQGK